MTTPAVEVQDLVMRYGSVTAVNGLNLTVEPGTVTAILGPNGAGKTTTIETCEGFRRPQSGSVRVLGLDLLIERLGMQSYGRTPYRRLSGGQQQRLSLAMAIVGRPELVFLDEPTAGLDPQARRSTWELISELRSSGVTVVLTTHFMDEAEVLADVVHIVDEGQVIASGTPQALAASGAQNTVRFTARPGIDVESLMLALPDDVKVDEVSPGSYVIAGDVDPALLATFTAWCATHGVLTESVLVERQTLEDRFLELTGKALR